jgi:hypothetical protein
MMVEHPHYQLKRQGHEKDIVWPAVSPKSPLSLHLAIIIEEFFSRCLLLLDDAISVILF